MASTSTEWPPAGATRCCLHAPTAKKIARSSTISQITSHSHGLRANANSTALCLVVLRRQAASCFYSTEQCRVLGGVVPNEAQVSCLLGRWPGQKKMSLIREIAFSILVYWFRLRRTCMLSSSCESFFFGHYVFVRIK